MRDISWSWVSPQFTRSVRRSVQSFKKKRKKEIPTVVFICVNQKPVYKHTRLPLKVTFVVSETDVDDNILLIITLPQRLCQTSPNPQTLCNSVVTHIQIINHDPCTFCSKDLPQSCSLYTRTATTNKTTCYLIYVTSWVVWQTADLFSEWGLWAIYILFTEGLTIFAHLVNIIKENTSASKTLVS